MPEEHNFAAPSALVNIPAGTSQVLDADEEVRS